MIAANHEPANPGPRPARLPQWLIAAILIVLAAAAGVAHYHIVSKGTDHAIDFYSYYRSGQAIWQGLDPYQLALKTAAFLAFIPGCVGWSAARHSASAR